VSLGHGDDGPGRIVAAHRAGAGVLVTTLLAAILGCGARSGLETPSAPPDAGRPDVGADAAPCVPSGPERCGERDDDCDGRIDEGLPIAPIGEALALRTTEGDTGSSELCSSCRWAWDPVLAPTREGFLVPFHLGIYGGREMPALLSRRTDPSGAPLGEVAVIGDAVPLHMRGLDDVGETGTTFLDTELRIGTDDLASFMAVEPDGTVRVIRPTRGRRAFYATSLPIRDGVLSAWRQEEAPVRIEASRFDASGAALGVRTISGPLLDGSTLSGHTLATRLDAEGVIVFVVVFVSEPRSFTLYAIRLDADARAEMPVRIPAEQITLEQRASRSDGGYVLFDPGNGTEAVSRFVPSSLASASEPVALDPGVDGSRLSFDFLRIPGGFVAVSGLAILRLDSEGRPTASWHGRLAPGSDEGNAYVVSPDLARRDGRLFLTWHGVAEDDTPNTVWIRELACVDE